MKIKGFDSIKMGDDEKDLKGNQMNDLIERVNSELDVLKGITEDYRENIPDDDYEPNQEYQDHIVNESRAE